MPSPSPIARLAIFLLALASLPVFVGCSASTSPTPEGMAVLLESEPADALGVNDLKANLLTGLVTGECTIVGRVVGEDEESFDASQAVFMIRDLDLKVEEHDEAGDHSDCKFCQAAKAEAMESTGLVRVVDESGAIIQTDVRKLIGIKPNHIIVATGEGVMEDGTLEFNAKRVFIRP